LIENRSKQLKSRVIVAKNRVFGGLMFTIKLTGHPMVMDDKILIQGDLDPKPHQEFIPGMGIFGVGGWGYLLSGVGQSFV
jgi:hypothetical protein